MRLSSVEESRLLIPRRVEPDPFVPSRLNSSEEVVGAAALAEGLI